MQTIRVIQLCLQYCIPVGLENPRSSMMWHVPQLAALKLQGSFKAIQVDFCFFGTRWQKPTTCWLWNVLAVPHSVGRMKCKKQSALNDKQERICICKFSGQPHILLSGSSGARGFRTKLAEAYPYGLAQLLVSILVKQS